MTLFNAKHYVDRCLEKQNLNYEIETKLRTFYTHRYKLISTLR